MAKVHCKECGNEIDLDDAYHARVKGFVCESCNSKAIGKSLIFLFIALTVGCLLFATSKSGSNENPKVDYSTYSMGTTWLDNNKTAFKSIRYDLGGEIPQGKELGDEWHEKYAEDILSLIRNTPSDYDFSSENNENWKGLVIQEESVGNIDTAVIIIEHPIKGLVTFSIETTVQTP